MVNAFIMPPHSKDANPDQLLGPRKSDNTSLSIHRSSPLKNLYQINITTKEAF